MLTLITIVLLIMLFIRTRNLSVEVEKIKSTIRDNNLITKTVSHTEKVHMESEVKKEIKKDVYTPPKTDPLVLFVNWFKDNWMLKLGVLLILAGFGWFMSYAFIHNWIGPVGRVVLGFVAGTGLTLFGSYRVTKDATQGKLFLILGSALVVITSYSARVVYDFFNPVVALGIVFLVSVYLATVALQLKMKEVAVYGILIAYLAPILTAGAVDVKLLFSYLAVVSLSSIWLASLKGWRMINTTAIIGFGLYTIPWVLGFSRTSAFEESFILLTIFGLCLAYFAVSIIGLIKNDDDTDENNIIVAITVGILIIFTTMGLVAETAQSLVLAAWMIIFAIGSYAVFTQTNKEKFFYVYSLISVVLLVVATALELSGDALLYAFAFESAVISIAGYMITRRLTTGYVLSMTMAIPIMMSISSLNPYKWRGGISIEDFAILLTVGILTCGLGWFYRQVSQEAESRGINVGEKFYIALSSGGSLFFLALIWLSAGATYSHSTAVMISLVIYVLIGIPMYFYGLHENNNAMKYYGAALVLLVVVRLIIIDVWGMDLAMKVVTFILIGTLFISTSFIKKGSKGNMEHLVADTPNQE